MNKKIKLTTLQEKSWRSAVRASDVAAASIKSKQGMLEDLGAEIEADARLAAKNYNGILNAIAGEHGLTQIPNSAQLQVVEGVSYFSWDSKFVDVKGVAKAKKKAPTKKRGRPKGSKNKPKTQTPTPTPTK